MGRQPGWMVTQTGRPSLRSPGRPPIRREIERSFWRRIADGLTSEDAGIAVGVSGPVGSRWFRERGGMPSISLDAPSGRYLSFAEREEIALLKAQDHGVREIARRIDRSPSTVSRELRRNAATRQRQVEAPGRRAVEGRARGSSPEDCQARRQPAAARVRPGAAGRRGPPSGRHGRGRSESRTVEGSQQATASRPALGHGVESGADLAPAQGRLPR